MRTERGFDRIVAFTDGVVAIAVTLLVLPLADLGPVPRGGELWDLLADHAGQFLAFAISFAVIARFWWSHHQLFEELAGYDATLVLLNTVWLFTVVVLPFPTALVGEGPADDRGTVGLYLGTLTVASLWLLLLGRHARRHPELLRPQAQTQGQEAQTRGQDADRAARTQVTLALFAVATAVGVALPRVGLYALLVLAATRPLVAVLRRRAPA